MADLVLTVAICTWNRQELLRSCLTAMCQLDLRGGFSWEVLVVNNNCTDGTAEVIKSFENVLPIRQLHEVRQGLSHARNTAVQSARGQYIVWTDDDAAVDRDWLKAYVDATRRWPKAVFFGGPVDIEFEGVPPAWLNEVCSESNVRDAYAARDLGPEPFAFESAHPERFPFGVNYAIQRAVQANYLYDTDLGLKGNAIVLGEETEVMKAVLAAGHQGYWVPDARVRHVIIKSRQTESYLRRRFVGWGRTAALQSRGTSARKFLGIPLWIWSQQVKSGIRYAVARSTRPPSVWIAHMADFGYAYGAWSVWARRSLLFRVLFFRSAA